MAIDEENLIVIMGNKDTDKSIVANLLLDAGKRPFEFPNEPDSIDQNSNYIRSFYKGWLMVDTPSLEYISGDQEKAAIDTIQKTLSASKEQYRLVFVITPINNLRVELDIEDTIIIKEVMSALPAGTPYYIVVNSWSHLPEKNKKLCDMYKKRFFSLLHFYLELEVRPVSFPEDIFFIPYTADHNDRYAMIRKDLAQSFAKFVDRMKSSALKEVEPILPFTDDELDDFEALSI